MTIWAHEERMARVQIIGMKKTTPAGRKLYGRSDRRGKSGSG